MGRKDEEIASLKAQNQSLAQELKSAKELYNGVMLDKEQLGKMLEDAGKRIDIYMKEIERLNTTVAELSRIPLMDLEVNVTGVQDIKKTLDDSVTMMKSRLHDLGMDDDFKILAHPHTLSLSILKE